MSLTHRCNLRCSYCMPADGLDRMADSDRLTDGEVVRLVGIVVARLGIREVRFTGGEPCCAAAWSPPLLRSHDCAPDRGSR
ncbi:radical SAM superfamily protein [Mycobacterium kansasii]|uniref:Radical SAM superfamily protein n=1 Tax=Mycobacterium kansasii TaxID=1768 RepID=A0A1V3X619_MYCKA|nr:radical SAM superfamily protein [Mycobacterium kansasii]